MCDGVGRYEADMNIRALQCPTSARLQELVLVSHGTALPGLLWSDITVRPGHRHPQTDATISHSTRLSTPAQESFNFNNFNQNHFFIYVCDLCALNFSNIFIDLLLHYQSYKPNPRVYEKRDLRSRSRFS